MNASNYCGIIIVQGAQCSWISWDTLTLEFTFLYFLSNSCKNYPDCIHLLATKLRPHKISKMYKNFVTHKHWSPWIEMMPQCMRNFMFKNPWLRNVTYILNDNKIFRYTFRKEIHVFSEALYLRHWDRSAPMRLPIGTWYDYERIRWHQ
jgi:hypothetical protein